MAVILTGSEYIDLDAHGAALDIRQRPLAFYAELRFTEGNDIMLAFSHGRVNAGGSQEWSLFLNISNTGRVTSRWQDSSDSVGEADTGGTGYNDGNLHRVLVVVHATGGDNDVALFIDGSVAAQSGGLGANVDTADFNNTTRIGTGDADDVAASFNFIGEISNAALWDVEISDTDAQDLTAGTIDPGDLTSGLQGWWPLGFDAADASGNDRHGTTVGDPEFTEDVELGDIDIAYVQLIAPEPDVADATIDIAYAQLQAPGAIPVIDVAYSQLLAPQPEGYQFYSDGTAWHPVTRWYTATGTDWHQIP